MSLQSDVEVQRFLCFSDAVTRRMELGGVAHFRAYSVGGDKGLRNYDDEGFLERLTISSSVIEF
jgi:hypothetical protein